MTVPFEKPALLLYTQTAGYRHKSMRQGIAAVKRLGLEHGFVVEVSEKPEVFHGENLRRFQAVCFLNTSGNILDTQGRTSLEAFVKCGGGFAGVHAACDTGYDWPWYETLVGAYFKRHPRGVHPAIVQIEDAKHPSTRSLPNHWSCFDEWYDFRKNPREIDGMGVDHPIIWCHERAGGRAWHTSLGHSQQCFRNPQYLLGQESCF